MTFYTDPEALRSLNEWYEIYRRAYAEWCDLASCVRTALAHLKAGEPIVACIVLESALRDHSPPVDG